MIKFLLNYQKRISTFFGLFLGIFLLSQFLPNKENKIKFEDLALGKDNVTVMANFNNKRIHCGGVVDLDLCLKAYNDNDVELPVTLWLGNSQLHAINQYRPGDETAALILHKNLKNYGHYTLTFSQANANFQEHYLLLGFLLEQFPIKTLVIPTVFDDLREDEIRPSFQTILKDQAYVKRINKTSTGKSLILNFQNIDNDLVGNEFKVSEGIIQNNFENLLEERLGKIWPIWDEREILRGTLFGKLYKLRNSVFRINASTIRNMIPERYVKNMNAFKDILNLALDNNLDVLVYIPPIRNDIKIPYNIKDYNNFKKEIHDITKEYEVNFFSLENLVPPNFWGKKSSTNLKKGKEIDFMHFQAKGHQLLAESLFLEIIKIKELINKP